MRCLLLFMLTACVLGSHFRGAIFMVRPNPGGGENEVSDILVLQLMPDSCGVNIDNSLRLLNIVPMGGISP